MTAIHLKDVNVSIQHKRILKEIHMTVQKGDFLGLIGPNGSGKTTLLKTIANILTPDRGEIFIQNRIQHSYTNKELAKCISYVPQETSIEFNFRTQDIVAMGRYVHRSFFSRSQEDADKVMWAMEVTNTLPLLDRSILQLSGGQRQLVMIAKALAQDTPILLLDEPIASLDVYYQLHILHLLKKLSEEGRTIVIVLHDLNLASRFCRHLVLLNEGSIQSFGTPKDVMTQPLLQQIYHVHAHVEKDERIGAWIVTPYL